MTIFSHVRSNINKMITWSRKWDIIGTISKFSGWRVWEIGGWKLTDYSIMPTRVDPDKLSTYEATMWWLRYTLYSHSQIEAYTQQHGLLCRWRSGCTTRMVIGRWVTLTSTLLSAPVKRFAFSTAMWFQSVQYIQSSNTASENTCGTEPSNTVWRLPPSKSQNLSRTQRTLTQI